MTGKIDFLAAAPALMKDWRRPMLTLLRPSGLEAVGVGVWADPEAARAAAQAVA